MPERVYTVEGAAEVLMVAPRTIRHWLREKKLGGVKVGRLWRVRESDINAFLKTVSATCIAYDDNGNICNAPAYHLDITRGGMVCDRHRPRDDDKGGGGLTGGGGPSCQG